MKFIKTILLSIITVQGYAQSFSIVNDTGLPDLYIGSVGTADLDNDGFTDLILTGFQSGELISQVYLNNADATFASANGGNLTPVFETDIEIGDFNSDGLLDILLAGTGDDGNPITALWKNIGNGSFSLIKNSGLDNVDSGLEGNAEFRDVNNDGNLDILLSGFVRTESGAYSETVNLYINNGDETFSLSQEFRGRSGTFGDYDKDGDLDITTNGALGFNLYLGDGQGQFESQGNSSVNLIAASMVWLDFDLDGHLDQLISGRVGNDFVTLQLENTGISSDPFTIIENNSLTGYYNGSEFFIQDFNNDGQPDFIIDGIESENNQPLIQLYINNNGLFNEQTPDVFPKAQGNGDIAGLDLENDGDIDLIIIAKDDLDNSTTFLFRNDSGNNTFTANTPPSSPMSLGVDLNNTPVGEVDSLTFAWDISSDTENSNESITYNLYVISDNDTIVNAESGNSGFRNVLNHGNSDSRNTFSLFRNLEPGDYEWSVQAIDISFVGSQFATIHTFHINFPPSITGTSTAISTPEESSFALIVDNLTIDDPDNQSPGDFSIIVFDGDNYTVTGNEIIPDADFNGTLTIPIEVNDGIDTSDIFEITIEVTPVNDIPVITGTISQLITSEETPLLITIDDIEVVDPDNVFPNDFTLVVESGSNYSVSNNEVTPNPDFFGVLNVPVVVNDGEDDSEPFIIPVEVTEVLGLNDTFINDNFLIFPNSATDNLNILSKNGTKIDELSIYSINGSLIKSLSNNRGDLSIDITPLPKGSYFLRISTEKGVGTTKVIKK